MVEFGVEIGEYRGVVRVPRRVFQRLLPEPSTPERCVEVISLRLSKHFQTKPAPANPSVARLFLVDFASPPPDLCPQTSRERFDPRHAPKKARGKKF